MLKQTDQKSIYVDIVKGVAIFCMLWGHFIQYCVTNSNIDFFENSVFKVIYTFHMPLFMLVSGYLFWYSFQKRDLKELIVHRSKPLIHTIIFCSIFNYYITTGVYDGLHMNLGVLFGGKWLYRLGDLWFLWSVLSCSVAVAFVFKKFENKALQTIVLIAAVILLMMFPNAEMNVFMYPYFVVGFIFSKYRHAISRKIINLKYITIPLFPVMCCFYEKKHYIYTTGLIGNGYALKEHIVIDIYRWVIGFVGSVFVLTVIEFIYNRINKKDTGLGSVLFKGFQTLGKNSLQIYCLSVALLSYWLNAFFGAFIVICFGGRNIFAEHIIFYNFGLTLAISIIYSVILIYAVKIIEKIKLSKILFGK